MQKQIGKTAREAYAEQCAAIRGENEKATTVGASPEVTERAVIAIPAEKKPAKKRKAAKK